MAMQKASVKREFNAPEVSEHERGREDHGGRVGDVLAHDVLGDVSASRLEEGVLSTDVAAGDDSGSTNEGGTDVGQDVTVTDHDPRGVQVSIQKSRPRKA